MTADGGMCCRRELWPFPSMQQKFDGSALVYHFTRLLLSAWFTASSEHCCQHLFSRGSPLYQNVADSMVHRFIRTLLSASAQPWFTASSERYCQHESPLHQNAAVGINHRFIRTSLSASAPVVLVVVFSCGCSSGTVKPTNGAWCSSGCVSRQVWATLNTHEQ